MVQKNLGQVFQTLQNPPTASLTGNCDSWFRENNLAVSASVELFPPEDREFAQSLGTGIFPRLSLFTFASILTVPTSLESRRVLRSLEEHCRDLQPLDLIAEHHGVKDVLVKLLNECSNPLEIHPNLNSVIEIDVQHLAVRVVQTLSGPETGKNCLSVMPNGSVTQKQDLVDLLYDLLGNDTLKPFRPIYLSGLLRLTKATNLFPKSLIYNNVVIVESRTAITSGAFGDVWRGLLGNEPVAMKVMRTANRAEDVLRCYSKEAIVWSQLRHPNVLPFYGTYCWNPHPNTPSERLALLSPWLNDGNAIEYLRAKPDVNRESLIIDIARGLNYLHNFQPPIVHGDLKGNNILITSAGRACIADFGLSTLIKDSTWATAPCYSNNLHGCELFNAPELLFYDEEKRVSTVSLKPPSKTVESDVYAFGCVCYEIYTGKPRFLDLSMMARLLAVRNNEKCDKPLGMTDELWACVEASWSVRPEDRPNMARVLEILDKETDRVADLAYDNCDRSTWDGMARPHVPFDLFQVSVRSHLDDSTTNLSPSIESPRCSSFGSSTVESPSSPEWPVPIDSLLPPFKTPHISAPTLIQAKAQELDFRKNDIIIALMGPTGTGKSTFINDVMGALVATVGHGINACTRTIDVYGCEHLTVPDRRVFLVDTPGFGVGRDDQRTLEELAQWLCKTYQKKISLSAVLYFMSIGELRFTGRDRGNMNIFQRLCGVDAFKNVAIVTTGWEDIDGSVAAERERSLKSEFLKEFIAGGGRVQRYRRTDSVVHNAWDIVDMFDGEKRPLLIQDEIVNKGLSLWMTSAFKAALKFRSFFRRKRRN